jgi:hypothetical protein
MHVALVDHLTVAVPPPAWAWISFRYHKTRLQAAVGLPAKVRRTFYLAFPPPCRLLLHPLLFFRTMNIPMIYARVLAVASHRGGFRLYDTCSGTELIKQTNADACSSSNAFRASGQRRLLDSIVVISSMIFMMSLCRYSLPVYEYAVGGLVCINTLVKGQAGQALIERSACLRSDKRWKSLLDPSGCAETPPRRYKTRNASEMYVHDLFCGTTGIITLSTRLYIEFGLANRVPS